MSMLSNPVFPISKVPTSCVSDCNRNKCHQYLQSNSTAKAAGITSVLSPEISHLVGSCTARWGEMLQARFTLSFHCFSLRPIYLDLQFATLLSPVWSNSSSGEDSGLYHVIKRSISVAWGKQKKKCFLEEEKTPSVSYFSLCILQQQQRFRNSYRFPGFFDDPPVTRAVMFFASCSTCVAAYLC